MFRINKNTNKVFITKGDNAEMVVSLVDINGKPREVFRDDEIVLTVRKQLSTTAALVKNANDGVISFVPTDTSSLPVGLYRYDIQLTTFNNKTYTIVADSVFEIGGEVSQ